MMKTSYDLEADAFYARFAPESIEIVETKEAAPGVMIDLDGTGNIVGIEVLSVKARGLGTYHLSAIRDAAE